MIIPNSGLTLLSRMRLRRNSCDGFKDSVVGTSRLRNSLIIFFSKLAYTCAESGVSGNVGFHGITARRKSVNKLVVHQF